MKPKSFLLTFILSFFFLHTLIFSEEAVLHQYIKESPLLYARIPFSWQNNQIFSKSQNEKVSTGVLRALTKPGKLGQAIRQILNASQNGIEFMAIGKKEWPIPGLILSGKYSGDAENFAQKIMVILRESLAIHQGVNMDWIKFKKKNHKTKLIYKTYVMFWHVWIIMDNGKFKIMSSPNDPKFNLMVEKTQRERNILESGSQTKLEDFFVYCDFTQATSFYQAVMKDFVPDLFNICIAYDIFKFDKLKIYSHGSGVDFSIKSQLSWKKDKRVWWQSFADQSQNNKSIIKDSQTEFTGFMKLPNLKLNEFNRIFYAVSPKSSIKGPAYYRLYQSLGKQLSFSWSNLSISPVFRVDLKNAKNFNKELSNIIRMYARINVEKEGKKQYTHIIWGENTVSYYIEDNFLYFSPLLHGLKDFDNINISEKTPFFSRINYPSKGNVTNAYYSMIHLILQVFIINKKAVNPNDFPAFSQTTISQAAWDEVSSFKIDLNSETMDMTWQQPYGLPGLIAGSNVPASAYISFFTLLSLTINSF